MQCDIFQPTTILNCDIIMLLPSGSDNQKQEHECLLLRRELAPVVQNRLKC